jgi:Flp pilus assembly protein protease CpaA
MTSVVPLYALVTFNGLLWCAAVSDLRTFRIPNLLPALLAFCGVALAFPASPAEALSRTLSFLAITAVAGATWWRGLLGGGDFKLLMGCALWIPLPTLPAFAIALGLASGVQGLTALLLARTRASADGPQPARLRQHVPFALSIAAAGLCWSLLRA